MSEGAKTAIWIAVWIGGLFFVRKVLNDSDSVYPMLDESTPNPDYDGKLNGNMATVSIVWTLLCFIVPMVFLSMKAKQRD